MGAGGQASKHILFGKKNKGQSFRALGIILCMAEQIAKIRLGISACLLGQAVRYDGGHKHDRFITETLGQYVDFVPVCPEVECGLGIPREAMRLVEDMEQPRLVTYSSGRIIPTRCWPGPGAGSRNLKLRIWLALFLRATPPAAAWSGSS